MCVFFLLVSADSSVYFVYVIISRTFLVLFENGLEEYSIECFYTLELCLEPILELILELFTKLVFSNILNNI